VEAKRVGSSQFAVCRKESQVGGVLLQHFQNKRVTEIDCWKRLKTKGFRKCGKFEAIRKPLKRKERAPSKLGVNQRFGIKD
jgi:uncharacterized protein YjhX (UPF0386 family)